ncbi:hypothetical protein BDQ12DRAFT_673710 [Crucibulum laeve]|uniref:Uncharacterized protein n=1 Tax=Crucibulum laeve TaxID=68775 RepID=A0A5C3MJL0_9AGAR|nr:hypothetical protein BDQ12DRAFT_673710 [Crucibulum laeve]
MNHRIDYTLQTANITRSTQQRYHSDSIHITAKCTCEISQRQLHLPSMKWEKKSQKSQILEPALATIVDKVYTMKKFNSKRIKGIT